MGPAPSATRPRRLRAGASHSAARARAHATLAYDNIALLAAAPFFLHVTPAKPARRGTERRGQDGVQSEFHFDPHGVRDMDTCLVEYSLPDFEIAAIETGQGGPGADAAWAGTARFD